MAKDRHIFAVEYTNRPITPDDEAAIQQAFIVEHGDYDLSFIYAPHAEGKPGKIWITDTDSCGMQHSNASREEYARLHGKLRREMARRNMLVPA